MTRPIAALAAALLLSSCSSQASDGHAAPPRSDQPVITGQAEGYNADDVAFATNMIPHHQQAVDLSALVPDRTTHADLIALAKGISVAQLPEINVICVDSCHITTVPRDVFLALLQAHPETYFAVARVLSGDLQLADRILRNSARRSSPGRKMSRPI